MNQFRPILIGLILLGGASYFGWKRDIPTQQISEIPKSFQGEWILNSDEGQWPRVIISPRGMFFMRARPNQTVLLDPPLLYSQHPDSVMIYNYRVRQKSSRMIDIVLINDTGAGRVQQVPIGSYTLLDKIDFDHLPASR